MKFTGERYLPNLAAPEISYEHWHRYLYATQYVKGKTVLDVACGEGYGSHLLAKSAKQVVGVDISEDAIKYATEKYSSKSINFLTGNAISIPVKGISKFDVIVSFETIEHISKSEQDLFMAEVKRLLKPNGVFIVSTPDKLHYTDIPKYHNPFHIKEFYVDEFMKYLGEYFSNVEILSQRIYSGSYIWTTPKKQQALIEYSLEYVQDGFRPTINPKQTLYAIAICSNEKLPSVSNSFALDLSNRMLEIRDGQIQALIKATHEIEENKNEIIKSWEERWADLQSGTAWKLTLRVRSLFHRLAPIGSVRYKFALSAGQVIYTWRREGFRNLINKVFTKLGWVKKTIKQFPSIESAEDRPKISIVIPVFNALNLTQQCIESIYRETQNASFEVIVINNASKDDTKKWLEVEKKNRKNFRPYHMDDNIGFGPAINIGFQKCLGDFMVILNNDTIVSPGWLDNMLSVFKRDITIGIVSPMTNFVGEGPQIDVDAQNLPPEISAIQQYSNEIQSRSDLYMEPNRLVFFCVMLRRELIDIVGYLDPAYEKGNFEDDDYCLRTRMAGYKLAIAKNSFVYHLGSATFTKNKISHSQYMEQNRRLFYGKAGRIATASRQAMHHIDQQRIDISVVVRTVNRPLLLQKSLTSLANQTAKNFEVLVINDAGKDVSELLEKFRIHFPITYIHNDLSQGRSGAANTGIEKSRGDWIAFLDDDDILYPWHFEALLQAAQLSGQKFIYGDFNRALFLTSEIMAPDNLIGAPPFDFTRRQLLVQNFIPIHTWLLNRSCIVKTGMFDKNLDRLEDYDLLLRISSLYPFHHLRKVTCEYRFYLHSTNSIYTDRRKSLDALKVIYDRHPADNPQISLERQKILQSIEKQIVQIEGVTNKIGDSLTEAQANRETIRLVTGL